MNGRAEEQDAVPPVRIQSSPPNEEEEVEEKGLRSKLERKPASTPPMPRLPEGFRPLIGTEEAKVDEKGRLLFSKAKRDRLDGGFALVLGKSGGISLYPQAIFDQLFNEIFSVETMNPAREEYTRFVLANAHDDLTFDPQGRLVIPARLRKEALLQGDALIIGCGDRIEIWDRDEWVKFNFAPEKYNVDRREAIESAYSKMLFGRRAEAREESA